MKQVYLIIEVCSLSVNPRVIAYINAHTGMVTQDITVSMNVALSTVIVYMFSYIRENCITNKFELFSKWFVFEDNCVGNAEIILCST